jgi:GT2 family glycosyltransferase
MSPAARTLAYRPIRIRLLLEWEPAKQMQFVAVMNSFNRRNLLVQALESLVQAVDAVQIQFAIVVFDAGSTDGSREWLASFAERHPEVRLEIIEPSGQGDTSFSAGVNLGCRFALQAFPDAEFLFLYETDNWISRAEPLISAIRLLRKEPQLAAAGFTVRLHSGRFCGWGQAFPTVLSFVLGPHLSMYLGLPHASVINRETDGIEWFTADAVFTSPLLVKSSFWRSCGGFDPRQFPFSDSDLDWAWRVAREGYLLGVIRTDAVVHDNLALQSSWSNLRVLQFHRSRFRLLRKYRGRGVSLAIPFLFLRHVMEYALLLLMVLIRRRPMLSLKKRSILLKSVWAGYESVG